MPYIGLDVGTSGCKASVIDHEGNLYSYAHREYETQYPKPGYVEIDARVVWQAVQETLHEVAAENVTALAIASFGEAVILLDERDRVLDSSIYYSDIRGSEEAPELLKMAEPSRIEEITGLSVNPMFSACKLRWLKKYRPELLKSARRTMLFGDYIAFMLTGERVIDYSLASRTMLFDIKRYKWSEELAEAFALPVSGFSAPVRTGAPIGTLRPEIAERLALPPGVLVVAGGHDQVLSALGGGAVEGGNSVDGMGSSECISLVIRESDINPKMAGYNFCCEPYVFEHTYLTLAFNASAGTAIRWFRDCFNKERALAAKAAGENIYTIMDSECRKTPSDALFLPYVAGSGTPTLDSSLGGALLGLKASDTKADIYRAVLEGVCFEMQYNVELLRECGLTVGELTAVGGCTRSAFLMQIKADVMNREVHTLKVEETGTLALAMLCAKAKDDISELSASSRGAAKRAATYTPNPENVKIYQERMENYRRVYPAVLSIFNK